MFQKTSVSNPALISNDDLRAKYGFRFPKDQEPYFTQMVVSAQKACADYMDMDSLQSVCTCRESFELSSGQNVVVLSGTPFKEIVSVKLDGVETSEWMLDSRSHVLRFTATASSAVVEYMIGWGEDVPEDILYAVAMTVQHMSRTANSSLMGKNSQNTDGGSETYEQSIVPLAVRQYLDHFRNGRMA